MRKAAIFAMVWLVASAALGFGALAFGDSDGGGQTGHCEYEHGVLICDSH